MNREQFKRLSFKKQRQYIKRQSIHRLYRHVLRCFLSLKFQKGIKAYRSYKESTVPEWFHSV